jgi:hypothetical protein
LGTVREIHSDDDEKPKVEVPKTRAKEVQTMNYTSEIKDHLYKKVLNVQ